MSKHSRSKNILSKLFLILLLFLCLTVLSTLLISANSSILVKESNMVELYAPIVDDSTFLMRWDINSHIVKNPEDVILFYSKYTNNETITLAIINNAIEHNVPLNIAFSVAWAESRFNPDAYNNNGSTADRGLFQLNDLYRNWTKNEYYNIELNAHEGTRYLSEMITLNDGDIVYALYCYNAGPTRVRGEGIIPNVTKKYVDKVLEYEDILNQDFNKWVNEGHS